MLNYLLDEHIPPSYRAQLLRRESSLTVWMIGDVGAPAKGTLDPEILCWCEAHDFLLVTNNRKSMPRHLADHLTQGRNVPGILTLDLGLPMRLALDELILIASASFADEYANRITYLPIS